jgi:DNA-binding transcriptional ArsR family regulator
MSRPYSDADAFRAVAHPARRQLLDLLRKRGHNVGELLVLTRLSASSLTRHLAVLRSMGLVTQQRRGTRRLYALKPQSLRVIRDWIRVFDGALAAELPRLSAR